MRKQLFLKKDFAKDLIDEDSQLLINAGQFTLFTLFTSYYVASKAKLLEQRKRRKKAAVRYYKAIHLLLELTHRFYRANRAKASNHSMRCKSRQAPILCTD